MYHYDEFDAAFVRDRVARFRDQVDRRISGALTEDEFKPLRLQNGLYLQLHAYMLRVAVPYGTLNGNQMRQLATIADRWDKGYGHFTTRQNIQFNWPKLRDVPEMLDCVHSDIGQLHSQRDRRSLCRRRCRRNRRSTPDSRTVAPMVNGPSRIRVPAAQVQDRRHWITQ